MSQKQPGTEKKIKFIEAVLSLHMYVTVHVKFQIQRVAGIWMCTLSYSHEIYLLQSKTNYMYFDFIHLFSDFCSCIQSPIVSTEY